MKHIVYPDDDGRTVNPYELNELCMGCRFLRVPQPSNIPICLLEGLDPKIEFYECLFRSILPFDVNPYTRARFNDRYLKRWLGVN